MASGLASTSSHHRLSLAKRADGISMGSGVPEGLDRHSMARSQLTWLGDSSEETALETLRFNLDPNRKFDRALPSAVRRGQPCVDAFGCHDDDNVASPAVPQSLLRAKQLRQSSSDRWTSSQVAGLGAGTSTSLGACSDLESTSSLPLGNKASELGFNSRVAIRGTKSADPNAERRPGNSAVAQCLNAMMKNSAAGAPLSPAFPELTSVTSCFGRARGGSPDSASPASLSPTSAMSSVSDFARGIGSPMRSPGLLSPAQRSPPGLPRSPQSSPMRSSRRRAAVRPSVSPLNSFGESKDAMTGNMGESRDVCANSSTESGRAHHRRVASVGPEQLGVRGTNVLGNGPRGGRNQGRRVLNRPVSEGELLRQAIGNSQRLGADADYGGADDDEDDGAIAGFSIPRPSNFRFLVGASPAEASSGRQLCDTGVACFDDTGEGGGKLKGKPRGPRRHSEDFEQILEGFYGVLPAASDLRQPGRQVGTSREADSEEMQTLVSQVAHGKPRRLKLGDYILGQGYEDISKYFLLHKKELGSGHYGVVRKCKEIATGKIYACKTISKWNIKRENHVRDIQKEVSCLSLLQQSPGFVSMKATFEDEDHVHMVMELCKGGDLLEHIVAHGPLSEGQGARLCKTLVESLWHCHKVGVVHRDVKPENILLTGPGADSEMKLVDFGVATFLRRGGSLKEVVGTPDYMAPEVYRRCYTAKADIWSAGVVLYAALSGIPPFWASSDRSLKESILHKEVSFKSTKWDGKSEECKDLIRSMLDKDPHTRISPAQILIHPWVRKFS